jgi:hypothetical protein
MAASGASSAVTSNRTSINELHDAFAAVELGGLNHR